MLRKTFHYIGILLVLTLFWIILNEKITVLHTVTGVVTGFICIICTEKYLLKQKYALNYTLSFKVFAKYLVYLFIQIYVSGITAIYRMLTNKVNIGVIEYESDLDNDFLICVLANSITLTPGTVTLDKSGRVLKILCLNCPESDKDKLQQSIKLELEKRLKGVR